MFVSCSARFPLPERPRIIDVDAIPDTVGETWVRPDIELDDIAYLQYTSGSTRVPAGVEITHRAVGTNALQMVDSIELNEDSRGVTWLPLFHDMGLLTVILPALGGKYITIMSPRAFVQRPYRWIKELAAVSDGGRHLCRPLPTSLSSTLPRAACRRTARPWT